MEKRYQVFVSSTFTDLLDERRAAMQALLELDCIPAGMELFPASEDDAWTLIKRVIDDCDYYLVILAGRYGSRDAAGISYTEKEYDYAVEVGKPVLGFLHADPGSIPAKHTDTDAELQRRLAGFREKVQRRICKFWTTPADLGTAITTSYAKLIKTHPAEGWVKGRFIKTTEDAEKVAHLLEQVRTLEKELEALRKAGVVDTSGLAQGEDLVELEFEAEPGQPGVVQTTWNAVFAVVGRSCLGGGTEDDAIPHVLRALVGSGNSDATSSSADMVKVQLACLGLIRITMRVRQGAVPEGLRGFMPTEHLEAVWELTDYGRVKLADLIGVKRVQAQ